jgi:hypothetical protein
VEEETKMFQSLFGEISNSTSFKKNLSTTYLHDASQLQIHYQNVEGRHAGWWNYSNHFGKSEKAKQFLTEIFLKQYFAGVEQMYWNEVVEKNNEQIKTLRIALQNQFNSLNHIQELKKDWDKNNKWLLVNSGKRKEIKNKIEKEYDKYEHESLKDNPSYKQNQYISEILKHQYSIYRNLIDDKVQMRIFESKKSN